MLDNKKPLKLWYKNSSIRKGLQENDIWERYTLPIGNGDMGANIYGEPEKEIITFNEKTLWTGGPSKKREYYNGGNLLEKGKNGETLKKIQKYFLDGRDDEASKLCDELVGADESAGYGSYQAFGTIYINYNNLGLNIKEYYRYLDLNQAIAGVHFLDEDSIYNREYFLSNIDDVLVAKLSIEGQKKLDLDISFISKQGAIPRIEDNKIVLSGELEDNGLKYAAILKILNVDGELIHTTDRIRVKDAKEVYLYISAKTDYKNEYPKYRTGDLNKDLLNKLENIIKKASEKSYEEIKNAHIVDYKNIFNSLEFNLSKKASSLPTDELLYLYNDNKLPDDERRYLEELLFAYGRYLAISSSRENSLLPSNLQGVWNNVNNPAWACDYHLNVNLQMNYWHIYSTNLVNLSKPLIDYVESLRKPGRISAKIYMGIESKESEENGFIAHTQNNPFGWTCPGWNFDWGWSPAAIPWILQNCYEYYEYTKDDIYLREKIYPMLREEANFFSNILIKDFEGKYVTAPTFSPEHGPRTLGNTYEQSLIWQLFKMAIEAGKILGEDTKIIEIWENKKNNLKGPIEIGNDAQIKEWYIENSLNDDLGEGFNHRHISHLLGVYPGNLITEDKKEWFEAAKVSINARTSNTTGWGMGQRILTYARLFEGNKAYELIQNLFKNGIYENLWDTHPPFQIDGNFAYTAGVSELLAQSHTGFINILPALPKAWEEGEIKGLLARGNFSLEIKWRESKLNYLKILSNVGDELYLKLNNIKNFKILSKDKNIEYKINSDNIISFDTNKNTEYEIIVEDENE